MKTNDKLMLMFSVLFLIFVILIFVNAVKIENEPSSVEPIQRKSITFILGEDQDANNTYFTNAEGYFRYNPKGRTDDIIKDARSLNDMNVALNRSEVPYSDVHIILHSNPWAGMSLPLVVGGPRLNAELLQYALDQNEVEPIDSNLIDGNTRINLHACGLGNNSELLSVLRKVFNNARIITSDGYVNFRAENGLYLKSNMDVYYAFYPTAYKPADLHIARQLANRYPDIDMNWMEELNDFSYQYNIPVEWEIQYPEYDVPSLVDDMDKFQWLMNQDQLLSIIEETGIPFDYFRWIVKKKADSVKVYGKVTVFCVLLSEKEGFRS